MQHVWKVLFELEAFGARLQFFHMTLLARVNRDWNAMYCTAWPILWRARRDEILRNPGWFGSWKRLCLDNLRKLLLNAVKGMHVKHVKVLTGKLYAKDRRHLFRRMQ